MIFLSHNWKDKDVIEPIAVRLKEVYGEENIFYDSWSIKPGENIIGKMSDNISDDKTFEREVRPLLKIKDAYPKILIARTRHEDYQYEGIQIYDLANWLLK